MAKHIFVTGGVVSSLGKGITAASIGRLLKARGQKVVIQKLDPYLNVDPGTMSPYQHGEVYVTDDGSETDLDLGHYERFIDESLKRNSNITAGSIYWSVVTKERKGEYLGATVQVIPHVTNEIKSRIMHLVDDNGADVIITEVGGTVGDIESLPFLEAIRQFRKDIGRDNVIYIHVTLIPFLSSSSELKTKPTQHSVKELRSIGIQPDIIVCRSDQPINDDIKSKIGLFCDLDTEAVISAINVESIYAVPLELHAEGVDDIVVDLLKIKSKPSDLGEWQRLVDKINSVEGKVKIALVGKYVSLPDAYLSVVESLKHAGFHHGVDVEISWVDADTLTSKEIREALAKVDGAIVPGGFGVRGIEGKIEAINYARVNKLPFFGICLGMQCAVVEFARNVAGMDGANSSEFADSSEYPVIDLMMEQKDVAEMGGTMRLGSYPCVMSDSGTKAYEAYQTKNIDERHRHRYELNNEFREELEAKGLRLSGVSPDSKLVEIVEIEDHPWFLGCQFHPEFKSRPDRPHPLFRDFIGAAVQFQKNRDSSVSIKS